MVYKMIVMLLILLAGDRLSTCDVFTCTVYSPDTCSSSSLYGHGSPNILPPIALEFVI